MIAVRMLSREEFAPRLSEFGCVMVDQAGNAPDPYYRWSYWRTSWGFHFYVPEQGPDRACPEHRFFEIMADVARQKPG